jgi:FAD/FMN-containing dehydrogenase
MSEAIRNFPNAQVLERLKAALPQGVVVEDEATCVLLAQDVFTKGFPALAVIRPRNKDELALAVKTAVDMGVAVVPRGGGMSYTSGYVPAEPDSVLIDISSMNRILEINETDMTVTVEAGCTWNALFEALKPKGLRTPFWGSLSGLFATIGGGMSQNAVFWGCGLNGSAVDSALGFEVVQADGRIVKTGARTAGATGAFWRPYGPDLTGLFAADTGAMGFKATVTLRLQKEAKAFAYASFSFKTADKLLPAMSEIGRSGIASECFAFDPGLQRVRMKRESLAKDAKALMNVMKKSGSVLGALKDAAQITLAGRSFLDDVPYSAHMIIEGRSQAAVDADLAEAKHICAQFGGEEIENTIPKIMRANPFAPVNSMLGPEGERWVPVHALVPHSKTVEALRGIEAIFGKAAAEIEAHGVITGFLFVPVGTTAFVIEPVFLWPDETTEIHAHYVEKAHFAKLKGFDSRPETRALVNRLRKELVDYFHELGAAHLQIGKAYRYYDSLNEPARELVDVIKAKVDPMRRVNPGSLGL